MNENDLSILRMVKGALRQSLVLYVPDHERKHVDALCKALDTVIERNPVGKTQTTEDIAFALRTIADQVVVWELKE